MKVSWFVSLFSWTSIILMLWGFMLNVFAWNLTTIVCSILMVLVAIGSAALVNVKGEQDDIK